MTTTNQAKRHALEKGPAGDVPAAENGPECRKIVRLREIPSSWKVRPTGRPDELLTVTIVRERAIPARPLASYIGTGEGVFGSAREADAELRRERDAWER